MPLALALCCAALIMVALAFAIERLVLRPLVNQAAIILFMATIGITFFLDGFGQALFGSDVYTLDLGIPKEPLIMFEASSPAASWSTSSTCGRRWWRGVLVAVLAVFFQRTRIGRALRAVADDHQAAQSVGIPLQPHLGHRVVGRRARRARRRGHLGLQARRPVLVALVALKALPVLMLGGLTSVPGAIVGGLIIGAGEKLSEVYLGPYFGGGIENWFAYVLALSFLLVRPQGLFGERIIERVKR